ncbi:DUF6970 domain-containing protein [Pontibacter fetidus]|uniref:DUF6970 domain-containing protein n=1 Tax=Pontibacter fetidus TaxID=2700082 RepID=A0A6B2H272_9BACT|nr:hypothetical protein [Pontibacter fetidus]NDK54427.1 hypothetical protein [Pontibacter fetidus]
MHINSKISLPTISTFLLLISFGCGKKEEVTCIDDCMESYLEQNEMVSYKGEEVGCKFFLSLYEYQNKQYYVLDSHCSDVAINPTDCNGNTLCETGNEKECNEFFKKTKYIGIVGIKP